MNQGWNTCAEGFRFGENSPVLFTSCKVHCLIVHINHSGGDGELLCGEWKDSLSCVGEEEVGGGGYVGR